MYPVSLPYAVESQRSSAAATRTSIGNEMRHCHRSMTARTACRAAGTAERGRAYSISRKRTSRRVVNTEAELSVNCRWPVNRVASRLTPGVTAGTRVPMVQASDSAVLDTSTSSIQRRTGGSGATGSAAFSLEFVLVSAVSVCGNQ